MTQIPRAIRQQSASGFAPQDGFPSTFACQHRVRSNVIGYYNSPRLKGVGESTHLSRFTEKPYKQLQWKQSFTVSTKKPRPYLHYNIKMLQILLFSHVKVLIKGVDI